MQTTSPADVGSVMADLRDDTVAGQVTREAIEYLSELFGRRNGQGIRMAINTFRLTIPEEQITILATSYTQRMRDAAQADPA